MATHDELWDAVCALPAVDPEALGQTVTIGTLRRVYESWADDGQRSFSIYRVPAGVVAIVAVPETMSFRLHFAPNGYPAATKVLSLAGDKDDAPASEVKDWNDQLCDAG